MPSTRRSYLPQLAGGLVAAAAALLLATAAPSAAAALRCSMVPGRTIALLRVEVDTALPHHSRDPDAMMGSGVRPGPRDSLFAVDGTPMPGARVRLLRLDSATRAELADAGITADEPEAFIRSAPYWAGCRTTRWTDTVPWVQRGDTGLVRATLAPREQWIAGVPVLVIPDTWLYPYPRNRGLAFRAAPDAVLTPAPALYELVAGLETPMPDGGGDGAATRETWQRARALAWARTDTAAAELEPARSMLWNAVLAAERREWARTPSRLGGTYRVTLASDDGRGTWFFRTQDRPGYAWGAGESGRTVADLLASPHAAGYVLAGYTAGSADALPVVPPHGMRGRPLVWLAAADRPTVPGNDRRRELRGSLELVLAAAPEPLWDALEAVSETTSRPSDELVERMARIGHPLGREDRRVRLPLTLRIGESGAVHADTSLAADGRRLRVTIERVDTLAMRRPF